MRLFRTTLKLLMITLVCLATTSCKTVGRQTTREEAAKAGSEQQHAISGTPLSKEQIIAVAQTVARERGWYPGNLCIYDEGNSLWMRTYGLVPVPELDGHDYQVVMYVRPQAMTDGGDLAIVVDRKTGAVLKVAGTMAGR